MNVLIVKVLNENSNKNLNWNQKKKKKRMENRKIRYNTCPIWNSIWFGFVFLLLIVWIGLVLICDPNLPQYTYVYYWDVYIAIN